jgi:hypothetical protein
MPRADAASLSAAAAVVTPANSRRVAIGATLADWFGGSADALRPMASLLHPQVAIPARAAPGWIVAIGEHGERAIRTPAWMLRQAPDAVATHNGELVTIAAELYVKPDDRWESNEVADLRPEIASRLLAVLDDSVNGARLGDAATTTLDDELVTPVR